MLFFFFDRADWVYSLRNTYESMHTYMYITTVDTDVMNWKENKEGVIWEV